MSEFDDATRQAAETGDRLRHLGFIRQHIERQGESAFLANRRLEIPVDDDGGGVLVTLDHVIPATLVDHVAEGDRRWVTLDEVDKEIHSLKADAHAIQKRADADPDELDGLERATDYAVKHAAKSNR